MVDVLKRLMEAVNKQQNVMSWQIEIFGPRGLLIPSLSQEEKGESVQIIMEDSVQVSQLSLGLIGDLMPQQEGSNQ